MAASAPPRMELLHSFDSAGTEIFGLDLSADASLIAAACNSGAVKVYHMETLKLQYTLGRESESALAVMSVRFRPPGVDSQGARHVLLAVGADGAVRRWHVSTGRKLFETIEDDNEVFACDYRFDGLQFATAGRDKAVRVYDDERLEVVSTMQAGIGQGVRGHTNRVFAVRYSDEDPSVLLSGGWDRCVHVWDTRTSRSQRVIFGANVCGDAVDVRRGVVLTGACRPKDPLELWDLGTGKKIRSVDWEVSKMGTSLPCNLYAARFSGDAAGRFIAAGGSGANEARLFERAAGDAHVGTAAGFGGAVFTLAWSSDNRLAVAGADGVVRLLGVAGGRRVTASELAAPALAAQEEAKQAEAAAAKTATTSAVAMSSDTGLSADVSTVSVATGEGAAAAAAADSPSHPGSPHRAAMAAGAEDAVDEWGADGSGDAEADSMLSEARAAARSGGGEPAAEAAAASAAAGGSVPVGSGARAARELARVRDDGSSSVIHDDAIAPAVGGERESKEEE